MPDDLTPLREPAFASALNDLDDLLMQSGKAFLLGAGCSKCAGLPLTAELTVKTLASAHLDATTKTILTAIEGLFAGAKAANIEDYLSELVDLVAIAERRGARGATTSTATLNGVDYSAIQLKDAVDQIKVAIAEVIDIAVNLEVHWKFIQAVHRPARPGRSVATRPVDYLVLNYDTLIESALALQKLRYADGMNGGNSAWWDTTTFETDGLAARVLKLHGSIDWSEISGDPLPRRIAKSLTLPTGNDRKVLIWPASTKYRETQRDPYAQLSSLARRILRPQSSSQTVLTVCGYSFSDSHINIEVERALRESGGELTVVVFTFDEVPVGELRRLHEDKEITDQVRIYARRGFFHGSTAAKSAKDLPWSKFENITRLLGGER
ncbi:MAG: SIR2 family protein [Geobacteraceae bacterium]|nr:SIR2 family protein [Geobacteraceae bacterium]